MYSPPPCWNLSLREDEDEGTRSDHVARRTWDLPMLDFQVPGRVVGHDLVKKARGFQHVMFRELLNGTLQKTNSDPFKKDKAERRKFRPANPSARAAGE